MDYAFGNVSKIPLPNTRSQRFSPTFTSRITTILGLTCRPIIHFKLILYTVRYSMDQCILFFGFVFVYRYLIVPASIIERTILFAWNYSFTFVKNPLSLYMWLYVWTSILLIDLFVYLKGNTTLLDCCGFIKGLDIC